MASVNSPLKPPAQTTTKDNPQNNGILGRRTSLSQAPGSSNPFAGNQSATRPGTRRRESSDFIQGTQLTSPTGLNKQARDDAAISSPPPSLLRRRTDFTENSFGTPIEKDEGIPKKILQSSTALPFGQLKRTTTGPASAGLNGPSSLWSTAPQSAGFSSMGAFGSFSLDSSSGQATAAGEKKSAFGSFRGESRFKGLMNAESSEETKSKVKDKASTSSLEHEEGGVGDQLGEKWDAAGPIPSLETAPYSDADAFATGSAALGGDDASPPRHHQIKPRDQERDLSFEDIGFASLGLGSDVSSFRDPSQRRDLLPTMTQNQSMLEPMSPTNTNPYQSPEGEKAVPDDFDADDSESRNSQFPGPRGFGYPARGLPTQFEGAASDRSQTSSAGGSRAFPNLSALGGLSGLGTSGTWSNPPGAVGTPTRTVPGFSTGYGESIFSPTGDMSSPIQNSSVPGSAFFGANSLSAAANVGQNTRGSKMGSLFPNAMQDQIRDSLKQDQGFAENNDLHQRNVSAANALSFASSVRDTGSPARSGRGVLDDFLGNSDIRTRNSQGFGSAFPSSESNQTNLAQLPTSISTQPPYSAAPALIGAPAIATSSGGSYFGRTQEQDATNLSNQMPASQQRQMVMPDRMRWIYRDPQGNTQGPWSGLEMHDWYKAGFFSPELQVKKLEDADYEPLAQLIRRIGNSREPFLVPQIGIPHGSTGPPGSVATNTGNQSATTPSTMQPGSAQPPFASSFPSFGTTLTAEQQNALERRKQEEQYLMARQKEHLAQAQIKMKQMQQMQGGAHVIHNQQLHHHSSAHSLQSQPSYGSITSPVGYQPSPAQGPIQPSVTVPGFFEGLPRNLGHGLGPLGGSTEVLRPLREDDVAGMMDRFDNGRPTQPPFSGPYNSNQQESMTHPQQVANILQERARLQREQEHYDMLQQSSADQHLSSDRLDQFHLLRNQPNEQQQFQQPGPVGDHAGQLPTDPNLPEHRSIPTSSTDPRDAPRIAPPSQKVDRFSLSEQVQKTAALAKQSPTTQPQSPWAKVESGLPQPFPPPQSSSPLPAPAAQRSRQNFADTLAAESGSRSQTPSVETPSATVAPWAKENAEGSKGPSLKEIQAMEAKKAAQQEEIAAANRRALAEQERQNQTQVPSPIPGLPSSASWASGVSPAVPMGSGASAWTKPVSGKSPIAPASTAKKTLAQIQKEEEARKTRAAASAASNLINSPSSGPIGVGGKRYADLAGKAPISIPQVSNGAWTTVGAGGKVKTPTGPAPTLSTPRSTAASSASAPSKAKSNAPAKGAPGNQSSNPQAALEDLQKWTKATLGKGLNSGISGKPEPICH